VSRAAGFPNDSRTNETVYQEFGWQPVTTEGNNGWSRLLVRLGEMEQSLRFIEYLEGSGETDPGSEITIPETGMGNGSASIEGPRGEITLNFHIHEGKLAHLKLATPSAIWVNLVQPMTEQLELADALLAVNSLDLSSRELKSNTESR
jgi:Ni,Fe-hydrogenase III large subunit